MAQTLLTAALLTSLSLSLSAGVLTLTVLVTVTALPSMARACVKRSVLVHQEREREGAFGCLWTLFQATMTVQVIITSDPTHTHI